LLMMSCPRWGFDGGAGTPGTIAERRREAKIRRNAINSSGVQIPAKVWIDRVGWSKGE